MPFKKTRAASSNHPAPNVRETLADRITVRYAKSQFDNSVKPFLPAGHLNALVTRKSIVEELTDKPLTPDEVELALQNDEDHETVVDYVLLEAQKVFAITLISGLCGGELNETIRHNFFHAQWKFLAPIFSKEHPTVTLKPDHIIPFISKGSSTIQGGFAKVYKVSIHHAHRPDAEADGNGNVPNLAIKEFIIPTSNKESQEDALKVWVDEIDTLDKVSALRHENLIEKIAAIKRGQQHCVVFLWAEGGDLRQFWQTFPRRMSASLVKDIISQLRGMADAVEMLHNPEGTTHIRHGDIKPENILRFPGPDKRTIGTFKISDFGSAKRHAVVTCLRGKTVDGRWATKVYEPPESMTNKSGATSRLYDIWSMGCVTLEWIIWLLYGNNELTEFKAKIIDSFGDPTPFYVCQEVEEIREGSSTTKYVAHIHPVVQGCFQDLSNDKECKNDTALCSLLDIVMNKLLVVNVPGKAEASASSNPQPSKEMETPNDQTSRAARTRATAKEFVKALDGILKHKNASSDSYWFTGRSREGAGLAGTVVHI
ncbi:putative ALK tyrosine kinase receptor [Leptodontidium sp. MPI-SDFR-AT-0119]|nr:putative ALK tyrosine kinase receptor [Leptodontidium sp. MPI-SDFR-AT-0119]